MNNNHVVLVNERDEVIGTMEKLEAHRVGHLHRAFSVMVINSKGEILIQKRASDKYHSGGLWSNTCCSHPRPGEDAFSSAVNRLQHEMGITGVLKLEYHFIYKHQFKNGLTEYEFDYVFSCLSDQLPQINTKEVEEYAYVSYHKLKSAIEKEPEKYTVWFREIVKKLDMSLFGLFVTT
ncbi:MAG: isopentenyl-diphosphate Delta-isomerase [Cyclobacteriaceae bacterium]|nr:isopentenyl-diphosphate Delta-isomerase [Cyclobacteriaceae bacterium]